MTFWADCRTAPGAHAGIYASCRTRLMRLGMPGAKRLAEYRECLKQICPRGSVMLSPQARENFRKKYGR